MSRPCSGTSTKTESRGKLVVSFHDLHPGSRTVCAGFLARLRELGVPRVTLLVVPCWHGAAPVSDDADCVAWLRSLVEQGHEICLHGFYHRADGVRGGLIRQLVGRHYTAGEGEFYQMDRATARERLEQGMEILSVRAKLPVAGFTPPAWLMSAEAREVAKGCGLPYSTLFGYVDLLQTDELLAAPTIVYSCRNAWRRCVSRVWVRLWARLQRGADVLRIAAHPGDFADPRVERSLYERIAACVADQRQVVTYGELAAQAASACRTGPVAVA